MAVAHDTATRFPATDNNAGDATTGDRTFSHAANANAKGALVMIGCDAVSAPVTGVLYGGQAMARWGRGTDTSEAGLVEIWFLGDLTGLGGTQTVTLQGCSAANKYAVCSTVTATTARTVVVGSAAVNTTTSANPSHLFSVLDNALVYSIVHSGLAAPTSLTVDGTKTILFGADYGQRCSRTARTNATVTGGYGTNVTFAWAASSEDWALTSIAIAETRVPEDTWDNFADGTIDTAKWARSGAGETETGGILRLSSASAFLYTLKPASLRDGSFTLEVVSLAASYNLTIQLAPAENFSTPRVTVVYNAGSFIVTTNGSGGGTIEYNPTEHRWLRFARISADTIGVYTSADSLTWTLRNTITGSLTDVQMDTSMIFIESDAAVNHDLDNFNLPRKLPGVLEDDFEDGTIDSTKWVANVINGGTVAETGGRLRVEASSSGSGSSGVDSVPKISLANNPYSFWAEVEPLAASGYNTRFLLVRLDDGLHYINMDYSPNSGVLSWAIQGTSSSDGGDIAYNATNHRWWKMTYVPGNGSWDIATSPDGLTWTTLDNILIGSPWVPDYMTARLFVIASGAGSAGQYAYFDNVFVTPATPGSRRRFAMMA